MFIKERSHDEFEPCIKTADMTALGHSIYCSKHAIYMQKMAESVMFEYGIDYAVILVF